MGIQAEIVEGSSNEIHIEAEDNVLPYVITQLRGDTLVITISKQQLLANIVPVKVTVGRSYLDAITVDNGASVSCRNHLRVPSLQLYLNSGGQFASTLDVPNLGVDMQGGSKANLIGQIHQGAVSMTGGSQLEAQKLTVNQCRISLNEGSKALLTVEKTLSVYVNRDSHLIYAGDPVLTYKVTNSSDIRRIR
jgi:hypothetical protein